MKERNDEQNKIFKRAKDYTLYLNVEYVEKTHIKSSGKRLPVRFEIDESGSKYYKIKSIFEKESRNETHAFISKNTGFIYKPRTDTKKSKIAKYSLMNDESFQFMFQAIKDNWFEYLHEKVANNHNRSWGVK
tara:strand:+ start:1473 stop:1868 length:396 start_codon:yes stop_codon:yes gene_type:complete